IAESRLEKQRTAGAAPVRKVTLDDLFAQVTEGTVKDLGIIIRADVQGSAEAIADAVERLGTEAVKPHVLLNGVGGITENDVRAGASVRVVRDGVVVYEGRLASLRRFKDDVKEVQAGYECGITVENFNDVKPGDRFEVFTVDKVAAKL